MGGKRGIGCVCGAERFGRLVEGRSRRGGA